MNKEEQITIISLILTLVLFGCMIYLLYIRPTNTHIKKTATELKQQVDDIKFTVLPNIQSNILEQVKDFPNFLKSISSVYIRSAQEDGCSDGKSKFLANGCDKTFEINGNNIVPAILAPTTDSDKDNWNILRYPS